MTSIPRPCPKWWVPRCCGLRKTLWQAVVPLATMPTTRVFTVLLSFLSQAFMPFASPKTCKPGALAGCRGGLRLDTASEKRASPLVARAGLRARDATTKKNKKKLRAKSQHMCSNARASGAGTLMRCFEMT